VAPKTLFGKPVQTDVDMIHAQLTRTKKMAFHENCHVLMNHSQHRKLGPVLHQEYGYSQRGREQVSYTCIFFLFELREIILELISRD